MEKEKQKWLRLEADDGWQVVIPESDIQPHAVNAKKGEKNDLAWLDCPCKPKMNIGDKIIIHNSFEDKERIDKAMDGLYRAELKDKPISLISKQ